MSTQKNIAAALAGCLAAWAVPASGQSLVSTGQSFVETDLLPGSFTGEARVAGLRMRLAEGWKTYWRAPGEAGVPPRFDFSASGNLSDVEILWPRPEMFESFGMRTIGYSDEVVLPLVLTPDDPAAPIQLRVAMELGVCREICVFEHAEISASLPAALSGGAEALIAALAEVPPAGAAAGVLSATCRIEGAGRDRQFRADLALAAAPEAPVVLIEGPAEAWFHSIELAPDGARLGVEATVALPEAVWISRDDIRITVLAEGYAADIRGCSAPAG